MTVPGQVAAPLAPRVRLWSDPRVPGVLAAAVLLAAIVVYPLALVLVRSLQVDGMWSLATYARAVAADNLRPLWNTVWTAALTSLLAMVAGTTLAFLLVRTDLPGRRGMRTLVTLPYAIPPFFGAMAWAQLLGPQGYLLRPLLDLLGIAQAPWTIYTPSGVVMVMAIHFFPLVFLTVAAALERMDVSLEEAARTSGAGTLQVMQQITIPLVLPAILAGGVLTFMGAVANFGIPALLGLRARFFVLTTSIYAALNLPDFGLATAMSMLLVVISVGALGLQRRIQRGEGRFAVIAGKAIHPQPLRLGAWRWPAFALAATFAMIIAILPIAALLLTSFLRYYGAPLELASLTTRHYRYILGLEQVRRAAANSVILASAAATLCMGLGTAISYAHTKAKISGSGMLDAIGTLPYAIPHTVIALAVLLAWARAGLYGTLTIMLLAYILAYLPFSLRTASATLQQIHDSLEEAGRVSGAGPLRTFRDIVLPLAKPGMLAGWILVFMPASRELTMSILLFSLRTETIGVTIFNMQDAGYTQIAAALSVVVLAVILTGNLLIRKVTRGHLGF
ncbi:MAG: iron ABC transporter permease [Armatimonadota bacterium]|nr:iron ABC transporter permease [Armatimonadota bacterium]MDR7550794.1 iron ABC transporter permease [Armatimonadota bacterium]